MGCGLGRRDSGPVVHFIVGDPRREVVVLGKITHCLVHVGTVSGGESIAACSSL